MKQIALAAAIVLAFAICARGEAKPEQIQKAIDDGVALILSAQYRDGHWPYEIGGTISNREEFQVLQTAQAIIALQESGNTSPQVRTAIKKGIDFILTQPPTADRWSITLTAQSVMHALYRENPARYSKPLAVYASMLCSTQKTQDPRQFGSWASEIRVSAEYTTGTSEDTHYALEGLWYAGKAGFVTPKAVWERAGGYFLSKQRSDGGWDYTAGRYQRRPDQEAPANNGTFAPTLQGMASIYICEEALADKTRCAVVQPNPAFEGGAKWIGAMWKKSQTPYTWCVVEQIAMRLGTSDFGGHDWYRDGAADMIHVIPPPDRDTTSAIDQVSYVIQFLAQGRRPVLINKLKRDGDWNLHRYDINNLADYLSEQCELPCQWRTASLEATADTLAKTPILWISGHDALKFSTEEKEKLKEYVAKGGTILAEDCCSKKPFDVSFRGLVKELWPDADLQTLPQEHPIYTDFRKLDTKPALMGLSTAKDTNRLNVIYIPAGVSLKWESGLPTAKAAMDFGADICLYVQKARE